MKYLFSIACVAAAIMLHGCSSSHKSTTKNKQFAKTKSGIEYKIVRHKSGTVKAKEGDYVEIHINTKADDSVVFDSRKSNSNQPAKFVVKNPSFHGDLAEGLLMMSVGDSAIFMVPVDSLKAAGQNLQPWMKPGGKITYTISMVSVKTAEQVKKEEAIGSEGQMAIDDKLLQKYFAENNIKPMKTSSGLYYEILTKGTGSIITAGKSVTVNYTGKTMDGNAFDSNVDPKFSHVQPFDFVVGKGNVIRGWDEGILLLNKGAKAKFYIPSPLAYGKQSPIPAIPVNGILIFEVEIVDFK